MNLGDVYVTEVNDFAGAGFSVRLDFGKFQVTQAKFDPATGLLNGSSTFGWDESNDAMTTVNKAAGAALANMPNVTDTYLAIDGFSGDLTGTTRAGWLNIEEFSMGGSTALDVENGHAAGFVHMAPFTAVVRSDGGMTQLLAMMASGTPISGMQIEGTASTGTGGERVAQMLGLGDVYITSVTDTDGPGDQVTFAAARYDLEQYNPTRGLFDRFTWNLELNKPTSQVSFALGPPTSAGNDVVAGGFSNTILDGQAGNDLLYGNGGNDTLVGGSGKDTLFGGVGADPLLGGDQNDVLQGGDDNDVLQGGLGSDQLTGGAGFDVFQLLSASESPAGPGRDTILDVTFDEDRIDLSAMIPGTLVFVPGGRDISAVNTVRVIDSPTAPGVDAVVQVNLSGNSAPELEIVIKNHVFSQFEGGDFIL